MPSFSNLSKSQRPTFEDLEYVSHKLSYPLRHDKYFKNLDKFTGWCNLYELFIYIRCQFEWDYFLKIIIEIVNPSVKSTKIRYQLRQDDPKNWYIRALQGHSIESISIDDHIRVENPNILLVHGTQKEKINSIKEKGLLKFRNDIHFISVGAKTMINHFRDRNANAFLYVTTGVLFNNGYDVFVASNGVYLVRDNMIPYKIMWELGTHPKDL